MSLFSFGLVMKIRVPDYYYEFKCIADKCPDTCCTNWDVVVDDDTSDFYGTVKGELGEKLRTSMTVDEDGDTIFECKAGRCPFLRESGLCDIQAELGEAALSYTCRQYPRFFDEFGALQEYGLSFSCPEASRIIINHEEKIRFLTEENPDIQIEPNDIDPELFMFLLSTRDRIFDVLQNREKSMDKRVQELYSFGVAVQKAIDNKSYKIDDIQGQSIGKSGKDVRKAFKKMEFIKNDLYKFSKMLGEYSNGYENSFDNYILEREYEYENFAVYMIFRYYLKAVDDYNALEKINLAILSYMTVRELGKDLYAKKLCIDKEENSRIMQIYSKEIEHSEENMNILKSLCN